MPLMHVNTRTRDIYSKTQIHIQEQTHAHIYMHAHAHTSTQTPVHICTCTHTQVPIPLTTEPLQQLSSTKAVDPGEGGITPEPLLSATRLSLSFTYTRSILRGMQKWTQNKRLCQVQCGEHLNTHKTPETLGSFKNGGSLRPHFPQPRFE